MNDENKPLPATRQSDYAPSLPRQQTVRELLFARRAQIRAMNRRIQRRRVLTNQASNDEYGDSPDVDREPQDA